MDGQEEILASAEATLTPVSDKQPVRVEVSVCDLHVPPAAESILGHCEYYYRPLHDEYIEKSGVATLEMIKAWADGWNPWEDRKIVARLLHNRSQLIPANSTDADWSRHANFMMRHIGCGHQPPGYYISCGYYYCSRYGALLEPKLSPEGKKWLINARYLLQENMEDGLSDNMDGSQIEVPCERYPDQSVQMTVSELQLEISNDVFKEFAFATHVPAYLDAGLADLGLTDLWAIGTQPNVEEWMDGATREQARISLGVVAGEKWDDSTRAAMEAADTVGEAVERALNELMKKFQ